MFDRFIKYNIAVILLLAVVLLGLLSSTSSAQYNEIQFDLNASSYNTPLPFDVPFTIKVTVPENTSHVVMTFQENTDPVYDETVWNKCFYKITKPEQKDCPDDAYIWGRKEGQQDNSAYFDLDRIPPNKIYRIKFFMVQKLDEEPQEIRTKTYSLIRRYFNSYEGSRVLNAQDVLFLRSRLIGFLDEGISPNSKILVGGDVFSGEIDQTIVDKFTGYLLGVVGARTDFDQIFNGFNSLLQDIDKGFNDYLDNETIRNIIIETDAIDCLEGQNCSKLLEFHALIEQIIDEQYGFEISDYALSAEITENRLESIIDSYNELQNLLLGFTNVNGENYITKLVDINITDEELATLFDLVGKGEVVQQLTVALTTLNARKQSEITRLKTTLTEYETALQNFARRVEYQSATVSRIGASTSPDVLSTNYSNYIALDIGLLYPLSGGYGVPIDYYGFNFYKRPVNKNANVYSTWQVVSLTLGITRTSIENEEDGISTRKGLISQKGLVTGIGVRVPLFDLKILRLNAGAVWVRKRETDNYPLNNDYDLGIIPYVGLSLDLDAYRAIDQRRNNDKTKGINQ